MSNIKIMNLGLKPLNSRFKTKKVVWPIYAWKCILPVEICKDIDILQKLLLSSIRIGNTEQNLLVEKLGLSKDLLKSVKERCIDEGYLTKQGKLTSIGQKKVSNENLYSLDLDNASSCEKVYLLKDAISGDVIPNFSIKDITKWMEDEKEELILHENNINRKKPSILDITTGLKTYHSLNKVRKSQQQAYDTKNVEIFEYDIEAEDEIDWKDINEKGDIEVKKENITEDYDEKKNKITSIKIWDDTPKLIYVESYIYIDPDKPNEWRVRSPLGKDEDFWFTSRLRGEMYKDLRLKEEIDLFVEITREDLKDKYAFNNHYKIGLFNQFPKIANYPEFKNLKEEIESVKRVEIRIKGGDEDYDTLFLRCQKALECLFGLCISKIQNKFELVKNINKNDFKYQVSFIASEIGINVPKNYLSVNICKSLFYVPKLKSGSIKDKALFMLYDAYYNENPESLYILKDMPEFYENINIIANNRNNTSHFNHISKEKTDFDKEVEKVLHCFDALITVLFSHYFRED